MSEVKKESLKKEIQSILKDADLSTVSTKKVRKQLEEVFDTDLSSRKKEIDELVLASINKDRKGKKNGDVNDDAEEDEEEDDADDAGEDEEQDDDEEEEKKPKRGAAKKASVAKRKKGSSDESDEPASENDDDEYSPKKKTVAKKAAGKRGRKKKADSEDDDSDEDWGKGKKRGAKKAGAGGAKRGGGGYTKPVQLSRDLADLLGEDTMPRHEVVKRIWGIIKERNLYDPKNKQFAICDDELLKIFGVKRFRTFGMMKFLKNHFIAE